MDIDKVFGRTADQVYEEVQRMIAETAAKYEKKVKNEKILVAAYSAALFLGMLSVLTYGRKLKGDFKNLKNHFRIKGRADVIRAVSDDACMLMSGFLSGLDPDYDYSIQIMKKDKK